MVILHTSSTVACRIRTTAFQHLVLEGRSSNQGLSAGEGTSASSQLAGNVVPNPGSDINPASLAAPEQEGFASRPQPHSEQSASASAHSAPTEPSDHGTTPVASPRQRSLRHPRSPRSPAAQRRAHARSKPEAAERQQSIRRLGAEPIGKKPSMDSAASLPVVTQPDDADRLKVRFASLGGAKQDSGFAAHVNGDTHHDSHRPHEEQLQETAGPADAASTLEIGCGMHKPVYSLDTCALSLTPRAESACAGPEDCMTESARTGSAGSVGTFY